MFGGSNITKSGLPLSIWVSSDLLCELALRGLINYRCDCGWIWNIFHLRRRVRGLNRLNLFLHLRELSIFMDFFYLFGKVLLILMGVWRLSPTDARACEFVDIESSRGSLRSLCEVPSGNFFAPSLFMTRLAILNSVDLFDPHR